jgi:hypothetical protein
MSNEDDPTQMKPGEGKLFTPVQQVNQYLSVQPAQQGNINRVDAGGVVVGQAQPDLPAVVQNLLPLMDIHGDVHAFLEGVVYEDYSFVVSDRLFGSLQQYEPKVHR